MEMDTIGMGTLVMSIYKSYGVVLIKGAVQLKLFPETKIKPFHSATQFKGAAQIE